MKVKITLVKIKIECLVCRFFLGLPQRTTYTVAREGFSGAILLRLNLNDTKVNYSKETTKYKYYS